jgi:hypothetical protein
MYDQALAVTVEVGQGTEYVDSGTSEQPERDAVTKVNVTVFNGGRRPISNVAIVVATMKGAELGENGDDFIQAKGSRLYQFDPIEDVYAPFGSNPTVRVTVRLEFEDITGMLWRRGPPSDELLMFPKERWWGRRRTGLRHQTRARRPG